MGRETGRIKIPEPPKGAPSKGAQGRQGHPGTVSQGGQVRTPRETCEYCEKPGHGVTNCPERTRPESEIQKSDKLISRQTSGGESQPKVPVRVFTVDQQQVPDPSEVIEGMIPIYHRLTKVLINPGAIYSFVNPNFMCGLDVKPVKLPYDLEVGTPTGDRCLIANLMYKNCEIWVGERKLVADLMSLTIKGYDVILEIDWLSRYHAQLDCKMKVLELHIPEEATLKLDMRGRLVSSALISEIRVRKLLS
ncbi:uncharacterized protein LOC113769304 [Coffea eugenioides]|uniref:uncharacterized protein LOC113769304 n=1 Tax=Coffea eugenioides TaxID=49369 RepID=UPI000F60C385|nr:uncharacterized protein LOC113769304 [Coffea eugenioides]